MIRAKVVEHKTITTFDHLVVALRTYLEMRNVGISHNWCCRTLNMVVDTFSSQCHSRGQPIPVSKAGRGLLKSDLIYEHGTPLSDLVTRFVDAYRRGVLSEAMALELARFWRVAYITKAEDQRLRDLGLRAKAMATPDERWAAASIEF
jgi:hypothetical protein